MTITVTFSTDKLNLNPGTPKHAQQVLENYLKGKGVVHSHYEDGKYVWGYERVIIEDE